MALTLPRWLPFQNSATGNRPRGNTLPYGSSKNASMRELPYQRAMTREERRLCRAVYEYDGYARRLVNLTEQNVVGGKGIILTPKGSATSNDLRKRWEEWTEVPVIDESLEWADFCVELLTKTIVDGELFLWFRPPPVTTDTPSHQRIKIDILYTSDLRPDDEAYMFSDGFDYDFWQQRSMQGGTVRYDKRYGRPTRYFFGSHINNGLPIPASEIVHIYHPKVSFRKRGVSWLRPDLFDLEQLRNYRQAYAGDAIKQSTFPGFVTLKNFIFNQLFGIKDDGGEVTKDTLLKPMPVGADELKFLPEGAEWVNVHGNMDSTSFKEVRHDLLASISVGYGINYNRVASDLAGINFTTGRMAALEDDAFFEIVQEWMYRSLVRIFRKWAEKTLQAQRGKYQFEYDVKRRSYLDPAKQAVSNKIDVATGVRSRREIILAEGRDPDKVFAELREEERMLREMRNGGSGEA